MIRNDPHGGQKAVGSVIAPPAITMSLRTVNSTVRVSALHAGCWGFESLTVYFTGSKCYGSTEVSKSSGEGSTPSLPAFSEVVTQLAECQFSKLDVAGSTPVYLILRW